MHRTLGLGMAELDALAPTRETPPFPLEKVAVAMLINLGNTASYLVSLPFVGFMVLSFNPNLAVNEVGYLSGLLEGAFHVGAVFGACIWAAFSERFGRRPAVLFGLAGSCVATLAFGFSPTFPVAMAARFMWGLLNGNIGVVKTMISDVCPDEHSARAFSCLGRVIGPAVGGLLSEPATKYPGVFGASVLLRAYPYALPCSVGALLSFGTLIVAAVVLEETRGLALAEQRTIEARIDAAVKARVRHGDACDLDVADAPQSQSDLTRLAESTLKGVQGMPGKDSGNAPTAASTVDQCGRPQTLAPDEAAAVSVDVALPAAAASFREEQLPTNDDDDEHVGLMPASAPRNGCPGTIRAVDAGALTVEMTQISKSASERPVDPRGDVLRVGDVGSLPQSPALPELPSPTPTSARRGRRGILCCSCSCARTCRLLRDPPVLLTTALYTGLGGIAIVSNEITSLQVGSICCCSPLLRHSPPLRLAQLMNAPEYGGLSWQSTEIGILNAVAGDHMQRRRQRISLRCHYLSTSPLRHPQAPRLSCSRRVCMTASCAGLAC